MPNILANFALNYGRQIEYSQQQEQLQSEQQARSALAQLRMQEVVDAKTKSAEADRLKSLRQNISGDIQRAQAADAGDVKSLQSNANILAKHAMELEAQGDFDGGKALTAQSKSMLDQAKTLQETQLKEAAAKQETLAGAALTAQDNPNPESMKALAIAAKDAGINPLDIPMPGTPQMKAFVDNLANKGRTVKERVELASKEAERKATNERLERFHKDEERDKQLQRSQTAAHQARMEKLQEREMQLKEKRLQLEEGGVIGGKKDRGQTATERGAALQLSEGLGQFTRHMGNLLESSASTTLGPFAQLKPGGTVTTALAQLGANKVTQQESQLELSDVRGMAKAYTSAVQAVMKGRAPTESQLKQIEANLAGQAGETKLTSLYKKVLMSEDAQTMAKRAIPFFPAEQTEDIKQDVQALHMPVTTKEIREYVRKTQGAAAAEKLTRAGDSVRDMIEKVKSEMTKDGGGPAAPAAPSKPALPAGWTVNVK
jgi:hypothetical protein